MNSKTPIPAPSGDNQAEYIALLQAALAKKDEENARQAEQIELLRAELNLLKHKLFGRTSEKRAVTDEEQGRLFDIPDVDESAEDEATVDDDDTIEIPAHRRSKRGRKPLPAHLERVDIIHDIDDEEKACACGAQRERIGEETSERLVYVPAQLYVERHVRLKYACRACEGTVDESSPVRIAPPPPQLLPKSFATPSLLAHILTAKFVDALPFYRQEKQFARLGIEMNRTTMCNWAMKVADACAPLIEAIEGEIRSGPLVQADETFFQVLQEVGRSATSKSYMWVFRGGTPEKPLLRYLYAPTRGAEVAEKFLLSYEGVVQTDGYKGYDFLSEPGSGVVHVLCWAHARRKFADVVKGLKEVEGKKAEKRASNAEKVVRYIRQLYKIERTLRNAAHDDESFLAERKKLAIPVLDKIKDLLDSLAPKAPPQGLLGKAIAYTLKHWKQLSAYVDFAFVTPDNNLIENAIRPFVVGRKNWLFSGHAKGAQASAAIYSLIETAKANGLEPHKYLQYVFEKLPLAKTDEDLQAIMPHRLSPQDLAAAEPRRNV